MDVPYLHTFIPTYLIDQMEIQFKIVDQFCWDDVIIS